MSKVPYKIWISSEAPFVLKSFGEYLVERRNFKKTKFTIEYPNLVKNKYTVFAIFKFKAHSEAQEVFAKFTTNEQIYLLKYFRIKVMKINTEDSPIYQDPT